ncbi:MAG: hypothetical protein IPP29_08095 [Bacteroidetes bacterium]|nr:hypothetical protein [Bacteroidota bacterium]
MHHSLDVSTSHWFVKELFSSTIDIISNGGLGSVLNKNTLFCTDSFNVGFASTKHANGVDWWIAIQKDSSDEILLFLFQNSGVSFHSKQKLYVPSVSENVSQMVFSNQGNKFAYHIYTYGTMNQNYALLFDFDRCTGTFSNPHQTLLDKGYLWGDAFSASGNYFYTCSRNYIFQINTTTYAVDTVPYTMGFNRQV